MVRAISYHCAMSAARPTKSSARQRDRAVKSADDGKPSRGRVLRIQEFRAPLLRLRVREADEGAAPVDDYRVHVPSGLRVWMRRSPARGPLTHTLALIEIEPSPVSVTRRPVCSASLRASSLVSSAAS